jgi:hypothetical protein
VNEPPTWRVDRGAWKLYVSAALVVVVSICLLVLGVWPGALVALSLAVWIGAHPYLRREWYRVGYADGYIAGATNEQRRAS